MFDFRFNMQLELIGSRFQSYLLETPPCANRRAASRGQYPRGPKEYHYLTRCQLKAPCIGDAMTFHEPRDAPETLVLGWSRV